jgi:hypothetical protein
MYVKIVDTNIRGEQNIGQVNYRVVLFLTSS